MAIFPIAMLVHQRVYIIYTLYIGIRDTLMILHLHSVNQKLLQTTRCVSHRRDQGVPLCNTALPFSFGGPPGGHGPQRGEKMAGKNL